jgi:uncharacterized membrane protein
MPSELPHSFASAQRKRNGVGGWLLLLYISLTFVAPIWQARIAVTAFRNLMFPGHLAQSTIFRLASGGVIYAGLAILSCVCGVMLWSENPRGVTAAKAYVVLGAATVITLYSILKLAGMQVDLIRIIFGRVGYAAIWYSYLVKLVRVQQTYSPVQNVIPGFFPSSPGVASP